MPDEDDKRVAGPDSGGAGRGRPAPPPDAAQTPPPGQVPPSAAPAPHPPSVGPTPPTAPPPPPGQVPPAAPAGQPQALYQAPPPPNGGKWRGQAREWGSRRPVQLLAAGVVGALIGGGAVGVLDVLDDDGEHYVRVIERGGPYGPGRRHWDRGPDDDWYRRMPPEYRDPRRFPPYPGEAPTEAPTAPSPAPTPTS